MTIAEFAKRWTARTGYSSFVLGLACLLCGAAKAGDTNSGVDFRARVDSSTRIVSITWRVSNNALSRGANQFDIQFYVGGGIQWATLTGTSESTDRGIPVRFSGTPNAYCFRMIATRKGSNTILGSGTSGNASPCRGGGSGNPPGAGSKKPALSLLTGRSIDDRWRRFSLPRKFKNPVVIAGPPSYRNRQPGVVRLRQVKGKSFQARFQEWRYLDGKHPIEQIDFLVINRGRKKQADGSIWEAGTFKLNNNRRWKRIQFRQPFAGTPIVLLTIQTSAGRTPVTVRARNVSRTSFEAALHEEEKDLGTGHPMQVVGFLAVFKKSGRGRVATGGANEAYRSGSTRLNHRFAAKFGQRIKLEEEMSKDRETRHVKEAVSVLVVGSGTFAQQVGDREADTTALRHR